MILVNIPCAQTTALILHMEHATSILANAIVRNMKREFGQAKIVPLSTLIVPMIVASMEIVMILRATVHAYLDGFPLIAVYTTAPLTARMDTAHGTAQYTESALAILVGLVLLVTFCIRRVPTIAVVMVFAIILQEIAHVQE